MQKILQKIKYAPAIIATLSFAATAFARVGGGQDYVDTSSSGSSGGGFGTIGGLIALVIFAVIVYMVRSYMKKAGNSMTNNVKNNLNTMGGRTNQNLGSSESPLGQSQGSG